VDFSANALIGAILDPDGPYDVDTQHHLHQLLIQLHQTADAAQGSVDKVTDLLRRGVHTSHMAKRILIASALGAITGEAEWFDLVFDDAASPHLSFEHRHALLIHLNAALVLTRSKLAQDDHFRLEQVRLRTLFYQLVAEMEQALGKSSFAAAPARCVEGRVVILTPQFLAPPHATTLRAMEYAKTLRDDLGKTPIIVESHAFQRISPIAFVPPFSSNRNPHLRAIDRIDVGGRWVEYYRIASDTFTLSDLVQTTALISALSPELVIAISCPFISAEAAALRFPTIAQPTISSMPITRRAQSFSWNASTREEQAVMERFGVADRRLFHMHPGFSAPAETPAVSRGELGLPQGAFVFAVVGGRLDDEVDGRFLNLLESIVENPNAHIAMMGRFDRFDTVMGVRPRLAGRVSFLGYRKDLLATLRICNAFLNPNRTGGGRSGAYAQYAGLPVLSLRYGDVASTIGEENGCISYAEIAERAARLMTDPSERVQGRAAALARAGEVIGVKRLVTRIYSEMNIAA
jgi:hypothetical protein